MRSNLIKVGGSLLTLSNLPEKIDSLIKKLESSCIVIVVGGGEEVRKLEKQAAKTNPEMEHWNSLQIMSSNSIALASHYKSAVIANIPFVKKIGLFFLDAYEYCKNDKKPNHEPYLPQTREVRSDSVSLRFAQQFEFNELYLLKSVDFPQSKNWEDACRQNYVDPFFHYLFNSKDQNPAIHTINLRGSQITQPFYSSDKI